MFHTYFPKFEFIIDPAMRVQVANGRRVGAQYFSVRGWVVVILNCPSVRPFLPPYPEAGRSVEDHFGVVSSEKKLSNNEINKIEC